MNVSKWRKKLEILLRNAGFRILESKVCNSSDIIAEAENKRIIVRYKFTKETDLNLEPLILDYAKKVRRENALAAILAIPECKIPERYSSMEKREELLKKSRVTIWSKMDYEYYKNVVNALGIWAKYPLLGDLGCREEFAQPVSVPAMKIKQGKWEFYVFKIVPEILLKIADVLRRVRDPKAYQRMVSKKRVKGDIKDFLEKPEAIFPTNLVCVFKEPPLFDNKRQLLIIPQKYSSVWIVDGQHRLYTFCHIKDENKRKNFELICAGFNIHGIKNSYLDREHQAEMFININQQSKRISKELLIAIALSFGLADRRMKIVEMLKNTELFRNKIKSIDTKGKIHITTFVETAPMKRLVENNGILSKWYGRKRESKYIPEEKEEDFLNFCFKKMKKYFSLVRKIFPEEWENPDRYILATDRGIRGLLRIMEYVLEYSNGLKDVKKAEECLRCLKNFDFRSSRLKRMYLGEGGANNLADQWIGIIQDTLPDFGPKPKVILEEHIQPGQEDKAEKIINKVLSNFKGEVVGELKHIDPSTFKYLKLIPDDCPIQIFIDGCKKRERCREEAEKLSKKRIAPIDIRFLRKLNDHSWIHDRWLADDSVMIIFGTDLKDESLGKTSHTIIVMDRPRIQKTYRAFLELWRSSSDELKKKGAKSWPLYRSKRFTS